MVYTSSSHIPDIYQVMYLVYTWYIPGMWYIPGISYVLGNIPGTYLVFDLHWNLSVYQMECTLGLK